MNPKLDAFTIPFNVSLKMLCYFNAIATYLIRAFLKLSSPPICSAKCLHVDFERHVMLLPRVKVNKVIIDQPSHKMSFHWLFH